MKNENILYCPNQLAEHFEVTLEDETVWLAQQKMALLFTQTKQNISLHFNNCFKESGLESKASVKESLTVQKLKQSFCQKPRMLSPQPPIPTTHPQHFPQTIDSSIG
jgi:hypothetical protein